MVRFIKNVIMTKELEIRLDTYHKENNISSNLNEEKETKTYRDMDTNTDIPILFNVKTFNLTNSTQVKTRQEKALKY